MRSEVSGPQPSPPRTTGVVPGVVGFIRQYVDLDDRRGAFTDSVAVGEGRAGFDVVHRGRHDVGASAQIGGERR